MVTDDLPWTDMPLGEHRCRILNPPKGGARRYTILYLHRLDPSELTADWLLAALVQRDIAAVCPLAGPCWWADRICGAFDEQLTAETFVLQHALPAARQLASESAQQRVGLLGIGMGGQGALRLAYKHPDDFSVVAAVAPEIDYQCRMDEGDQHLAQMYRDAEDARQDTATLHIHPLNWPRHQWFCADPDDWRWYESAERLRMKLYSLGVPYECDMETSADGSPDAYAQKMLEPALEFITSRLDQF